MSDTRSGLELQEPGSWGRGSRGAHKEICGFRVNVTAKSPQSCPTLCDPTDSSPPGSAVPGIFQARTLEWVAISFPNA